MKFLKKYKYYFLSFLIPLIIYILFFAWKGCFNGRVIAYGDMGSQYISLFQYLKDLLHGVATFPYSFSKGLGGSMYGTFWYYLSSPFNLLIYFFDDILTFFLFLTILKLSLSGVTMYIFMRNKFKSESCVPLLFSIAYSLMSYNINYYISIMWLDCVILAPLLLMGIDRMIHKKGSSLYVVILFLSIVSNYYMGYILVFFSLIYFLYSIVAEYDRDWIKNKKIIVHFFVITFLTGLMTSFLLIPSGLEFLNVIRPVSLGDKALINLNFFDFVTPFCIGFGNFASPTRSNFFMFVGTSMFPLVICYFKNSKITKTEKIVTLICYSLFLLPIVFPFLNMVWHMFTIPMGLNYRYAFLVTLFTILICYRSFVNLEVPKRWLKIYFILFLIFSISLGYLVSSNPNYYATLDFFRIILTILLSAVNIRLIIKGRKKFILILMGIEIVVNLLLIGSPLTMVPSSATSLGEKHLEHFSSYCPANKRCEIRINYTLNDSLLENYSGVTTFLSTLNKRPLIFLSESFGIKDSKRNYIKYHFDIVLDMLLGLEVVELENNVNEYELLEKTPDSYILKNPNALSLGYLVSTDIKTFHSDKLGFLFIEELLNAMDSGEKEYFFKLPLEKISDKEYRLIKHQKYPYLHVYSDPDKVPTINGIELEDEDFVMVGDDYGTVYDEYGDTLIFKFEESPSKFEVYAVDVEKLSEFKENRVELEIDENTGNKIIGHIEVKEKSTLFTTIPYERGWTVKVDGKKVENYEVVDTFLAIDIEEGTHVVTFEYHIPGLTTGIIVSIFSFLALLFYKRKESTIC